LLDSLGGVDDEHITVLGKDGPDLMCAQQVTHLCTHERLEADSASLVIVPRPGSLNWLTGELPSIRRALGPNGRLALCIDPLPSVQSRIRRLLTLHGFAGVRTSRAAGRQILCAEVPAFGLARCAPRNDTGAANQRTRCA
jgi:hypothetical protein